MLRFPYLSEPLTGPPPPSLATGAVVRWRPLVPIRILGPTAKSRFFPRAVVDSGADDTVFPLSVAASIGAMLKTSGHGIRWRGQLHSMSYGAVELELADQTGATWRWPAIVAFSTAPLRYPILGHSGGLQYFDVSFRGQLRITEIDTNSTYPGTTA